MPTVDARSSDLSWVEEAVAVLRRGGLVAFPTETVYGLGARALDPVALCRIFVAKGRPKTHPLIAHVLEETDARSLAARWPVAAERLAQAFWPGPLTLVVPKASHVPGELTGGGASVALRAPNHPVARALLRALGEPIAAPSANRYQTVSPTTAAHVARSLGDKVDLIVDGGPCQAGIESTVVDVSGDAPVVLRPGAIDFHALRRIEPMTSMRVEAPLPDDAPRVSPGMDARHYAPRTPLRVATSREAARNEAAFRAAQGERVALLLVSPLVDALEGVLVRVLGPTSEAYAHLLYATLHELDEGSGLSVILVEPVPDESSWAAVADRLSRADDRTSGKIR